MCQLAESNHMCGKDENTPTIVGFMYAIRHEPHTSY